MKFVLYGVYDPSTYADARVAAKHRGFDLELIDLGCESVLIAFDSGGEIDRTYDMDKMDEWMDSITAHVSKAPSHEYTGGYVQDPLPGLEYPPCR